MRNNDLRLLIEFLGIVASAGVILVGSHFISNGTLQIGTLLAAIYLLQLVFQPLQELSDVYGMLQSAAAETNPGRRTGK